MEQAILVHGHVSLMSQQEKKTSVVTVKHIIMAMTRGGEGNYNLCGHASC